MSTKFKEKCTEFEELEEAKRALERKVEETTHDLGLLQSDLADRNSQIELLDSQLAKFNSSLADISKSYDTLQVERERVQESLIKSNLEVQELLVKLETLENESKQASEQIYCLDQAKSSQETELRSALEKCSALEERISALNSELEDQKRENESLFLLVEDLTQKAEEVKQEREAEVTRYQNEIEDLTLKNLDLSETIVTMTSKLEASVEGHSKLTTLEGEVSTLSSTVASLENNLQTAQNQCQNAQAELVILKATLGEKSQLIDSLQSELTNAFAENEKAQSKDKIISEQQETISYLESRRGELDELFAEQQSGLDRYSSNNTTLIN